MSQSTMHVDFKHSSRDQGPRPTAISCKPHRTNCIDMCLMFAGCVAWSASWWIGHITLLLFAQTSQVKQNWGHPCDDYLYLQQLLCQYLGAKNPKIKIRSSQQKSVRAHPSGDFHNGPGFERQDWILWPTTAETSCKPLYRTLHFLS